jgi:ribosomal protein S18 acetylase RimI-like enzyme
LRMPDSKTLKNLHLRREPFPSDIPKIGKILASTGLFRKAEIDVAKELLEDFLAEGDESGYSFIMADYGEELAGYICYGPIPMAEGRFDLYWISVREDLRGTGIGAILLQEAEKDMKKRHCEYVYIDTSSREDYAPTRRFYEKYGYREVARVPKFFADDDDKLIYMKEL